MPKLTRGISELALAEMGSSLAGVAIMVNG